MSHFRLNAVASLFVGVCILGSAMWSSHQAHATVASGQACTVTNRTQLSTVAGEGVVICNGSTWQLGSGNSSLARFTSTLASPPTQGASCGITDRLAADPSGTILSCVAGIWQATVAGASSSASTPSPVTFMSQTGLTFSTIVCSNTVSINTVSISGLSIPVYVSVPPAISGSPYLVINGSGNSSTTYGTVQNGSTVQVCATSASSNLSTITVPITIGSSVVGWSLVTGNAQPNAFAMGSPDPTNTCTTSNISGLTLPSPVTVTTDKGSGVALNINNSGWADYTGSQTISNNQSLCVKLNTDSTPGDAHHITVTIGQGVSGVTAQSASYTVTNPSDMTPDSFSLVYGTTDNTYFYTNNATIAGLGGPVPTSITGSGAQYSIGGGAWTSGVSMVTNGQTVQVRIPVAQSSASMTVGLTSVVANSSAGGYQVYTAAPTDSYLNFTFNALSWPGFSGYRVLMVNKGVQGGASSSGSYLPGGGGGGEILGVMNPNWTGAIGIQLGYITNTKAGAYTVSGNTSGTSATASADGAGGVSPNGNNGGSGHQDGSQVDAATASLFSQFTRATISAGLAGTAGSSGGGGGGGVLINGSGPSPSRNGTGRPAQGYGAGAGGKVGSGAPGVVYIEW